MDPFTKTASQRETISIPINEPEIILRRSKRKRKTVLSDENLGFMVPKTKIPPSALVPRTANLSVLPIELILMIFGKLPPEELLNNVRCVCMQWRNLIINFFPKIVLQYDMSKETVHNWITKASGVKHLTIKGRKDTNNILELVSKNCTQLEHLEVFNCDGSLRSATVNSFPMCRVIAKCPKLGCIHFFKTAFKSRRFFKLLSKKINENGPINHYSYAGPMNPHQLNAFLETIKPSDPEKYILVGNSINRLLLYDKTK